MNGTNGTARGQLPSIMQSIIAGLVVLCIALVGFIGKDFHDKQVRVMETQADIRAAQRVISFRLQAIERYLAADGAIKFHDGDR